MKKIDVRLQQQVIQESKEHQWQILKTLCSTFRSVSRKGIMIGLKALAEVIYHADKLHQWAEMRREVAHQTNLFELSLGGHSALSQLLSQRQLSVCIICSFKGMQGLMWYDLHTWMCKSFLLLEPWCEYRTSTVYGEIREPARLLRPIYILCLSSPRHSMAQKVAEESGLIFEYAACFSFLSCSLFSGAFHQALYWARAPLTRRLIDMLLQHCQGHICHLDSSRAVWHSPFSPQWGLLGSVFSKIGTLWRWDHRRINKAKVSFS